MPLTDLTGGGGGADLGPGHLFLETRAKRGGGTVSTMSPTSVYTECLLRTA